MWKIIPHYPRCSSKHNEDIKKTIVSTQILSRFCYSLGNITSVSLGACSLCSPFLLLYLRFSRRKHVRWTTGEFGLCDACFECTITPCKSRRARKNKVYHLSHWDFFFFLKQSSKRLIRKPLGSYESAQLIWAVTRENDVPESKTDSQVRKIQPNKLQDSLTCWGHDGAVSSSECYWISQELLTVCIINLVSIDLPGWDCVLVVCPGTNLF